MAVTLLMALAADTLAEAGETTAAGAVADDVLPLGFLEYLAKDDGHRRQVRSATMVIDHAKERLDLR